MILGQIMQVIYKTSLFLPFISFKIQTKMLHALILKIKLIHSSFSKMRGMK